MKIRLSCVAAALVCLTLSLAAQTPNSTTAPVAATVPRLITFSGTLSPAGTEAGENGVVLAPGTAPTHVVAITFSLYSEQTGGAPLWSEVQNVHVDGSGRYTVQLGATQPEGLPMDIFTSAQAQWLGVQPQGQAEQPRVMVVSVPYALKAADAETFGGLPPSAYALVPPSELNPQTGKGPGGVGNGGTGHDAPHSLPITGSGTTNYVPLWTNASTLASSAIYQNPMNGNIGIGTTGPVAAFEVVNNNSVPIQGTTSNQAPALRGVNTAASGNPIGVSGTVTSGTGGAGVYGINSETSGLGFGVIGTNASPVGVGVYGSEIATTGVNFGVFGNVNSPSGVGVEGLQSLTTGPGYGVIGITYSPGGIGTLGHNMATSGPAVGVDGQSESPDGAGVYGVANATEGASYGVEGESLSGNGAGVYGTNTATSGNAFGVFGQSASGYGVYGKSATGVAILGACVPTGSNTCYNGVAGINNSTSGGMNGVYALTESPGGSAVYMVNTGGGSLLVGTESNGGNATFYVNVDGSGYFGGAVQIDGNLNVGGTLTKGGGSFKIDDPLDPANKYLSHSFVESPDMMNIYNGNVTTDKRGLATVVLPNYFETLNRDFRYQLTVIGQFAQAIVAKEIDRGRFTIRTNKPGVKVSWQVTGIRQDAWANANRIPNEEDKPAQERGTYLHPELFGAPQSQRIHNAAAHRPADVSPTADAHGGN
ncbi:MAG: hypothetical protein ABSE85_17300 [Candidatus Korobacteraceae bacterium]|jgi:hypothetical protein